MPSPLLFDPARLIPAPLTLVGLVYDAGCSPCVFFVRCCGDGEESGNIDRRSAPKVGEFFDAGDGDVEQGCDDVGAYGGFGYAVVEVVVDEGDRRFLQMPRTGEDLVPVRPGKISCR